MSFLDEFALSFHLQSIHFPLTLCSQEAILRPNTLCLISSCVRYGAECGFQHSLDWMTNSESNMLPEFLLKKTKTKTKKTEYQKAGLLLPSLQIKAS